MWKPREPMETEEDELDMDRLARLMEDDGGEEDEEGEGEGEGERKENREGKRWYHTFSKDVNERWTGFCEDFENIMEEPTYKEREIGDKSKVRKENMQRKYLGRPVKEIFPRF